jgi:E3 ubiquitin-protein ligase UBR4
MHAQISFRQWSRGETSLHDWASKNKQSKAKGFENLELSEIVTSHRSVNVPVNAHLIKGILLNSCSKATRVHMKSLIMNLCKANPERELELLKVLCYCLPVAMEAGEAAEEFFSVFTTLINSEERKYFLSTGGYLSLLCENLTKEVKRIEEEEKTMSRTTADLTQGFALRYLVQILVSLLEIPEIIATFKEKESHIAAILSSFLSLRTIIVQKTSLTTECCDMLRVLTDKLQETEKDKQLFITSCIDALRTRTDNYTAIFVFERLCNMIVPYKEPPSYLVNLDKHRAQEYFFQGNMRSNPYESKQIGTKMADIATKILKDMDICSDFALELLVRNKIINMNLDIDKVYEQVWRQNPDDSTPMDVIFRFQGVDGEATEDVVDTLDVDNEDANLDEKCKITSVVSKRGGLELILDYLKAITDIQADKLLVKYILQFLLYSTKVKRNRRKLLVIDAVELLLKKCKFVFSNSDSADLAEMILLIIKPIVEEATKMSYEISTSPLTPSSPISDDGSSLFGTPQYKKSTDETLNQLTMFLERLPTMSPKIVDAVGKVLPFLTYGEQESILYLISYFAPYADFEKFDSNPSKDSTFYLSTFTKVVNAIPNDVAGNNLKSAILEKGITADTFAYLSRIFPPTKENTSDVWMKAYEKPGAPYAISLLQGLCTSHAASQNVLLAKSFVIRLLHKLEENTFAKEIATLSEGLMNALAENGFEASTKVNEIRSKTKNRKQKKATKTRDSVLKSFGLNVGSKGEIQLNKKSNSLNLEELSEEQGLTCCVCGDGHGFKPKEVFGIYNYAKVQSFGDFTGFASVTAFTIIHLECHKNAVTADARLRPPKSEWEGALIRNGFSHCNCLLPVLGPDNDIGTYRTVVENYWEQLAQLKSITERFKTLALDITSLVQKLAKMESLSVDSGGGGTSHNLRLVPFEVQIGTFILDDASERAKYQATLNEFLTSENLGLSTVSDLSAYYNMVLTIFLLNRTEWDAKKSDLLLKLFRQHKQDLQNMNIVVTRDNLVDVCRAPLMFVCLIDQFQIAFKPETTDSSEQDKWIQRMTDRLKLEQMTIVNTFETIADQFYPKLKTCKTIESLLAMITGGINAQEAARTIETIVLS